MKYPLLVLLLISCQFLSAQHSLVLKSGDKINCVVLALNNDVWEIFVDGKEKSVDMKEVSSVFFNEYVPYDGLLIPDGKEETFQ